MAQVGDAQEEADRIQDVTLARPEEISELVNINYELGFFKTHPFNPVIALNW